jgi:N-acetylmuramoyl-L-alanine amidase
MRSRRRSRPRRWLRLITAAFLLLLATSIWLYFHRTASSQAIGTRSEFADGACIAYSPTNGDHRTTVFLDPGHGGPDPGGSGFGPNGKVIQEKTFTLAVALDALPLLRHDGYRVVLSRTSDGPVASLQPDSLSGPLYTVNGEHRDIAARVDCANVAGAKVLLSIHFDSFSDSSVGGAETLYDPSRRFSAANLRLAQDVQQAVITGLGAHGWQVPDRGVQPDTAAGTPALTPQGAAYGHLLILGPASPGWFEHPSRMPGALAEPLFLTDPGEAAVVVTAAGQNVLAQSLVRAIERYLAG